MDALLLEAEELFERLVAVTRLVWVPLVELLVPELERVAVAVFLPRSSVDWVEVVVERLLEVVLARRVAWASALYADINIAASIALIVVKRIKFLISQDI